MASLLPILTCLDVMDEICENCHREQVIIDLSDSQKQQENDT